MLLFSGVETASGSFEDSGNIYSINLDGSDLKRMTYDDEMLERMASYSLDGKRIVYIAGHTKRAYNDDIWIMDSDGGNPIRITKTRNDEGYPFFFPGSKRIAYVEYFSPDGPGYSNRRWNLFTINVDGSDAKQINRPKEWNEYGVVPIGIDNDDAIISQIQIPVDNLKTYISKISIDGYILKQWIIPTITSNQDRTPVSFVFGRLVINEGGNKIIIINHDKRTHNILLSNSEWKTNITQTILSPDGRSLVFFVEDANGFGSYWRYDILEKKYNINTKNSNLAKRH